jgi:hypothetical protein
MIFRIGGVRAATELRDQSFSKHLLENVAP